MKIYTKTGDQGETSLFGGKRIRKDDLQIEAYGSVDELNTHLGLLTSFAISEQVKETLSVIQNVLFAIGSNLAAPEDAEYELPKISDEDIEYLEDTIDQYEEELEPLKNFILPGGSTQAAQAQVCRTVCRRAERRVVTLSAKMPVDFLILRYLNRLSDLMFVMSRKLNRDAGTTETIWKTQ